MRFVLCHVFLDKLYHHFITSALSLIPQASEALKPACRSNQVECLQVSEVGP